MDNVKNDNYYVQKIRKDVEFIVEHMRNVDLNIIYETLKNDIPEILELITA